MWRTRIGGALAIVVGVSAVSSAGDEREITVVARRGSVQAYEGVLAGRRDVWIGADAASAVLVASVHLGTIAEVSMSGFAGDASGLTAVLVTTTTRDSRTIGRDAALYVVRGAEIVCQFPANATLTPAPGTCGAGSRRTIALTADGTDGDRRAGVVKFTLTSRDWGDFSEPSGDGCVARAPMIYEPHVMHYEIGSSGVCVATP